MILAELSEIITTSPNSFDEAISIGVARLNKTLENLKPAWVQEQQPKLDKNGKIREYRVNLKVSFTLID